MPDTARTHQSSLTASLAAAQERHAIEQHKLDQMQVFRLYTETRPNLAELVSRYFQGATFLPTRGLWQGVTEDATVIEIVAPKRDLQKVTFLAGDIREVNKQAMVLLTYQSVNAIEVFDHV